MHSAIEALSGSYVPNSITLRRNAAATRGSRAKRARASRTLTFCRERTLTSGSAASLSHNPVRERNVAASASSAAAAASSSAGDSARPGQGKEKRRPPCPSTKRRIRRVAGISEAWNSDTPAAASAASMCAFGHR